jgi:hypothetical protein
MWTNALTIARQIKLTGSGLLRMGIIYAGGDNKPNQFQSVVILTLAVGSQDAAIVGFDRNLLKLFLFKTCADDLQLSYQYSRMVSMVWSRGYQHVGYTLGVFQSIALFQWITLVPKTVRRVSVDVEEIRRARR